VEHVLLLLLALALWEPPLLLWDETALLDAVAAAVPLQFLVPAAAAAAAVFVEHKQEQK
jgi:ABC-type transport system involved in cytochrome bd biosynthesis fused ATPase/permease subunit